MDNKDSKNEDQRIEDPSCANAKLNVIEWCWTYQISTEKYLFNLATQLEFLATFFAPSAS